MTSPARQWSTPDGIREELDLTLFIPCLNEEKRVVPTIETVRAAMRDLPFTFEILVTDDGSKDDTAATVEAYTKANPGLALRLHRNSGNHGLGDPEFFQKLYIGFCNSIHRVSGRVK